MTLEIRFVVFRCVSSVKGLKTTIEVWKDGGEISKFGRMRKREVTSRKW